MALRVKIPPEQQVKSGRRPSGGAQNRPAAPGAIGTDFGESVALLAEQPVWERGMKERELQA